MDKTPNFVTLTISVPAKAKKKLAIEFQKRAYEEDPDTKMIIETIVANKTKKAGEIAWLLAKDHNIIRKSRRIINMAKRIGIELEK